MRGRRHSLPEREVTPHEIYLRRREFLALGAATLIGSALATAPLRALAAGEDVGSGSGPAVVPPPGSAARVDSSRTPGGPSGWDLPGFTKGGYGTDEKQTPFKDVTTYNNFYEFGTGKSDPAANAHTLRPRPWTIEAEGELKQPRTIGFEDLLKWFPLEERIYRMRCVEAWSMVIPWIGFPLADLITRLEPSGSAKYVAFTTLYDPEQMPGQKRGVLDWPYVEGLRMDEAMHPLAILAVGLYGMAVAESGRGAPAARGAVEVRIQGDQVDRQDPLHAGATADDLEHLGAERVRLLRECESPGRPPPLEPGEGTKDRRVPQARHADVQWLRRSGREPLRGNGPAEELLAMRSRAREIALTILKPATFAAALLPLLKIGYDALLGAGLGADPIAEVLNRLGFWTLTILTASLSCTPAKLIFRVTWPLRIRRMLGLFAFGYAALHFAFYLGVDQFFDFHAIFTDIAKRKFILVGFAAFLILTLLAVTSPRRAVKALGFKKWKRIHRLVYAAAALGVIHFIWRVKADLRQPLVFLLILATLMAVRVVFWLARLRSGRAPRQRTAAPIPAP